MTKNNQCPQCNSDNTYSDANLWICLECYHEWDPSEQQEEDETEQENTVLDSNGNVLNNGDSVILIKDRKVKGASSGIRGGTKIRNIRIITPIDGHNISCKVDGIGAMYLKSEFVKKAT